MSLDPDQRPDAARIYREVLMVCVACELRDAEPDGLLCGDCRDAVDAGLDGLAADEEVFNCVEDEEPPVRLVR